MYHNIGNMTAIFLNAVLIFQPRVLIHHKASCILALFFTKSSIAIYNSQYITIYCAYHAYRDLVKLLPVHSPNTDNILKILDLRYQTLDIIA